MTLPYRDDVTRTWIPDVLGGFEQTTLAMPASWDGPVDAVLVRRRSDLTGGAAVLYVHGFVDYFFQTHLADFYEAQGLRFYALDLRRHGRALRPHQQPSVCRDIDEYLDDVDAAVRLLAAEEGVEWLLLDGHSTGGLVVALTASRGAERARIDAVVLNSPFLDMNVPRWQGRFVEPVLSAVGRMAPSLKLPAPPSFYGQSLHVDHRGAWSFDERWKPMVGFPVRAGWFRAIHRAHAEIERGLQLRQPVQVLHAGRSAWPKVWSDECRSADIVLDVDDMVRLAPRLGPRVEVAAVPGGIHDLVLSDEPARSTVFALHADWLARIRP